jgi:Na+-driven multidrug efflux pump
MQAANRVAKNTAILYARMAITMFISLYATRLIINALGSKDFGVFNVVGGSIAMLTFLNGAMAGATQRFMSYTQGEGNVEKQKMIFNVSVVLHFIIGLLVVILLEIVGYFLFDGILKIEETRLFAAKSIFHFLAISTFFTIISVPYDAVINAHENMLLVAIMGIFESLMKLGVALYVAYTSFDKLILYGALMAGIAIILMVTQRIYCHIKYEEVELKPKKYFDKQLLIEMTGFAGWNFVATTASMLSNYGQGIVLNMFFGTIVNAAQGVANQINGQLGAFSGNMLKALNPMIVKREGAGDRSAMINASLTGAKFSYFLLLAFSLPIIIEMPYILKIWLKIVPEYTIIFCQFALVISLIEQLFITLSTAISATGKIKGLKITVSILSFASILIAYWLFYKGFPPIFLYYVFILGILIRSGLVLLYAKKQCGLSISYFLKDVLIKSLIITAILTSIEISTLLLLTQGIVRLGIIFSVHILLFPFCIFYLGLNEREKSLTSNMLQNFLVQKLIQKH